MIGIGPVINQRGVLGKLVVYLMKPGLKCRIGRRLEICAQRKATGVQLLFQGIQFFQDAVCIAAQ